MLSGSMVFTCWHTGSCPIDCIFFEVCVGLGEKPTSLLFRPLQSLTLDIRDNPNLGCHSMRVLADQLAQAGQPLRIIRLACPASDDSDALDGLAMAIVCGCPMANAVALCGRAGTRALLFL